MSATANDAKAKLSLGNIVGIMLTVLTITAMLWSGATALQEKFDALDKRQQRIEDKVDSFMAAFHITYTPTATAAKE